MLGLTPPNLRGTLGSNALHAAPANCTGDDCFGGNVTQIQGFGVELLTVFLLVLVVLAVTDERRDNQVRLEKTID